MPNTAHGLPYPATTAPPNVPADLAALANAVDGWLPGFVRLATQYTHPVNNTTPANVTGMSAALGIGTWLIDAYLQLTPTTPALSDAKIGWTFSGTVSNSQQMVIAPSASTTDIGNTTVRSSCHAITSGLAIGTDGSNATYEYAHLYLVVTAAGTLQLTFAQNTANAVAAGLGISSHMIWRKVA